MALFAKRRVLFAVLTVIVLGMIVAAGCSFAGNRAAAPNSSPAETRSLSDAQPGIPGVNSETIADIVEKAGPAVVQINVDKKTSGNGSDPLLDDPFFREFFGLRPQPQRERTETGLGSGFIISPDGYILTNEHVISGADKITVTMEDKKDYPAVLTGADYDFDLALLKIKANQALPTLKLGDSDKIAVGNWVIAIGNPYGFDHTVTVGVISAKGRPVPVEGRYYKNLLQTDAAINPGNSGGPLLNLQGEVVGINTAVAQAQGIGFAIPTSTVDSILNDLKQNGKVIRPWIGIQMQDVTPEIAAYLALNNTQGVVVVGVIPDSPAQSAGLLQGDIIMQMDKKAVQNAAGLAERITATKIGQAVELTVNRKGEIRYITVKTGEKPATL